MIIDIIIVSIIVFGIMICFKNGFAKSLFSNISSVLGGIAIVVFYNDFTEFLKNTYIGNLIKTNIEKFINQKYSGYTDEAAKNIKIPFFLKDTFNNGLDKLDEYAANTANTAAQFVSSVVAIIVLIIIVKIIISVIPKVINVVVSLPVIKQCDKLLGCFFGIVCGVFWAILFVYVCGFASLFPTFDFVNGLLDSSFVLKTIYNFI